MTNDRCRQSLDRHFDEECEICSCKRLARTRFHPVRRIIEAVVGNWARPGAMLASAQSGYEAENIGEVVVFVLKDKA